MINNCPSCNKSPEVKILVSCQNVKCQEHDVEYFVWDWQELTKEVEEVVGLSV